MVRGFQGRRAEAYTELHKKYAKEGVTTEFFSLLILLAESTDQEPDFVLQRWVELNKQGQSHLYGFDIG